MKETIGRILGRGWVIFRSWPWWVQVLIALAVVGGLSQPFQSEEESPTRATAVVADESSEDDSDASEANEEAEDEEQTAPLDLEGRIKEALGGSNRGVPRIRDFYEQRGEVFVKWSIDENLTEGLTKDTARFEAADILEAVKEAGVSYKRIVVSGTYPLVDQLGNESEEQVVLAKFPRRLVERVKFVSGYFDPKTIFELDPYSFVHPAFVY